MEAFDKLPQFVHSRADQIIKISEFYFGDLNECYSLNIRFQNLRLDHRGNVLIRFAFDHSFYPNSGIKPDKDNLISLSIPARPYLYYRNTGVILGSNDSRSILSTIAHCRERYCFNPLHQSVVTYSPDHNNYLKDSLGYSKEIPKSRKKPVRIEVFHHIKHESKP